MIYFSGVSKHYPKGDVHALKDIDLVIDKGDFVSIIGHSGAGKTTLLKMITREDLPTSGNIRIEDVPMEELDEETLRKFRRKVGVISQDQKFLPNKTVYENLTEVMQATGRSDDEIKTDVPYVLDLVGLSERAGHYPDELSGGERQRLSVARSIINQPDIILADEPTAHLDEGRISDLLSILWKLHELGATIVLSSHNKDMAHKIGKRLIELEHGKIIRDERIEN